MWTAQRTAGQRESYEPWVARGAVTQSGDVTGVYIDGERRQFGMVQPGGYRWRPRAGDTVLVLKENQGDGMQHIAGLCEEVSTLSPGDVEIATGEGAQIRLTGDQVLVSGEMSYQGMSLEEFIRKVVGEMT